MRISNRMLYDQVVRDLNDNTEKLFRLNSQISSGKRIDRPSEDPVGMSSVLIYRTELNSFDQFQKTINQASGWLSRTESVISEADGLLARATELAVKEASATASADTREGAAEEIKQLRLQLGTLANSKYGNKYMFGGTRTQTPPFQAIDLDYWDGDVATVAATPPGTPSTGDRYIDTDDSHIYRWDGAAWQDDGLPAAGTSVRAGDTNEIHVYNGTQWTTHYQGNDDNFSVRVSKTDNIEVNLPGSDLFRDGGGDVYMALINLELNLRNNDQSGIQNALPALENASVHLNNNMASIGARLNRLENTAATTARSEVDTKARVSQIEDLDYAEAITDLGNQETIYQAALKSASMITSLSLVDYV